MGNPKTKTAMRPEKGYLAYIERRMKIKVGCTEGNENEKKAPRTFGKKRPNRVVGISNLVSK